MGVTIQILAATPGGTVRKSDGERRTQLLAQSRADKRAVVYAAETEEGEGKACALSVPAGSKMASTLTARPQATRSRTNPLHNAALDGSIERTAALLATGSIDIDHCDVLGWTPLMAAAYGGHSRIVTVLLSKGASVSKKIYDGGANALHLSTQQGHLIASKLLVEAGSDLDAVTDEGQTPLQTAAGGGHWVVVRFLVEAGANLNSRSDDGATALYFAASQGHLEVARELLLAKADPLLVTKDPWSGEKHLPLDAAAQHGHVEVVHELIKQVGIEGCGGRFAGVDALGRAAQWHQVAVLAILIDAGVVDTGIALHRACMVGGEAAVTLLLQKRREVWGPSSIRGAYCDNSIQPYGFTPLVSSFFSGFKCSSRVTRLLIDAGADTTHVVRITGNQRGFRFVGTPLALTNRCLREKEINGKAATQDQLYKLEAIRRMLLRVEAVHAVSWLWPGDSPRIGQAAKVACKVQPATTNGTSVRMMLPMMRRRARRRGMVWASLLRWVAYVLVHP